MSSAPGQIERLVEQFNRNIEAYKNPGYNETQLRREFIDPFFEALGWDVANKKGYAEAYKDVIHEDAIRVGGSTKAPDYCFRIGGARKFFVEAKKPSVNLKEEISPAYQLRRYAWSAKLPLSILTDFEEFAVYDCRIRPKPGDKASTGRILFLTYSEYLTRWGEIASNFSKQAVLQGSFDKFAVSGKGRRGTSEVDAEFLKEIERWRDLLAKNIALRNPKLTVRELNFSVQRTIDRIIFLRMCEDRGIETYGELRALLNGQNIYDRLRYLYELADDRYNSGLFHFKAEKGRAEGPDELTPKLAIDDKVLKEIIGNLYYPESPYEFSVLSADIMGNVYEQFLGKIIRLTSGHRAVIEEKPEVKKAGGVYYTPAYIVEYIVKNTVGKLCEGKTPKQISKLRILDPACGSGSFLIGAYTYLLDYHRDWYLNDGTGKHTKEVYQGAGDRWHLTTQEKKRLLLNNIYGVDIDSQAVEVTKLSLLLKVLEGENQDTLNRQLKMFRERALPDLASNIKCGNSLIGPDYYEGQQASMFDDEEARRVNAFDWKAEFSEIMKAGGFDAVIGNPPYIRMEGFKELKNYLKVHYASHDERSDIYSYFIERGHGLLKRQGRFGMIVSNKFLRANYGKPLREYLNQSVTIDRIVDFAGLPVFSGATVRTVVLLTLRERNGKHTSYYSPPLPIDEFTPVMAGSLSVEEAIQKSIFEIKPGATTRPVWSFSRQDADELLTRIQSQSQPLAEYCDGQIYMGIKSGLTEAFVVDKQTKDKIIKKNKKAEELIKPFLNSRDVRRYFIDSKDIYILYMYHEVKIHLYPAIEQYLQPFKDRLKARATRQEWYELQQPQFRFAQYMDKPKIIFPDIATIPRFVLDEAGHYSSNTTYFIPRRDLFLLGLLNSQLGYFYFTKTCAGLEGKTETYLRFFGQYLEGFPVPKINFSNSSDKAKYDKMIGLVESMWQLHKRVKDAKSPHDKTRLQRQIDATDKKIDRLVYELYGLTEGEIRIVQEQTMA